MKKFSDLTCLITGCKGLIPERILIQTQEEGMLQRMAGQPFWVSLLSLLTLDHTHFVQLCFYTALHASLNLRLHGFPLL
jgi:hypothetical protein